MPFITNQEFWPLDAVIEHGKSSAEELLGFHEHLVDVLAVGDRFAVIGDMTRSVASGAGGKLETVKFFKDHQSRIKDVVIGAAIIAPSPFIRVVVNGVFSLAPMPVPLKIFETGPEALAWISDLMGKEGLVAPSEILEYFANTLAKLE